MQKTFDLSEEAIDHLQHLVEDSKWMRNETEVIEEAIADLDYQETKAGTFWRPSQKILARFGRTMYERHPDWFISTGSNG